MKKLATIVTSAVLCITMLVLGPTQVIASAADEVEKKYISEVKVGMGETSDQASKELLADGYTILKDDNGEYADLNKDAGTGNALKEGPNQKIVYLGYKTTDDANDAITDLAVMNMEGGYSFEDYEKLMNDHMNTQIKPFVDRFIATLREYRENLQKPQDSANFKRANYYKLLLNKLTDDDTGNKPLGDLLVNQTKYEMGDEAYNALSDEEKKNHCDIVTLLMQGNGQGVQLMETELTKSADSSNSTWVDRFRETSLEKLTEAVKNEKPNLTPSEINKELDKRYNDDARKILDKWDAFNEILINHDTALAKAKQVSKDNDEFKEVKLNENSSKSELTEAAVSVYKAESTMLKGGRTAEDLAVHAYLEATDYGDGKMLEFFERDKSEFDDSENIRELYPIVEALTGGQLAGLDFLSIKDMFIMAISDENGFKEADVSKLEPASIYQDVNREIYDKGGVALTDAALRAKANAQEASTTFELSKLGYVLWTCTAVSGMAAAATYVIGSSTRTGVYKQYDYDALDYMDELKQATKDAEKNFQEARQKFLDFVSPNTEKEYITAIELKIATKNHEIDYRFSDEYKNAVKDVSIKSNVCNYIAAGFAVVSAVLAGYSIYTTISEMKAYYKVNFVPIPKYIVERTDITAQNEKGQEVMIKNQTAYYKSVLCNRTAGSSNVEKKNYEILKDRNDLNGDVGTQWLSLYSVKYVNGTPILADSLKLKTGNGDMPEGYTTGIHRFGEKNAFNLTSRLYCYNDPNDGTYVYFKNDTEAEKNLTVASSLFSAGYVAIIAVIGLIVGSAITLIIVNAAGKKKKKENENE